MENPGRAPEEKKSSDNRVTRAFLMVVLGSKLGLIRGALSAIKRNPLNGVFGELGRASHRVIGCLDGLSRRAISTGWGKHYAQYGQRVIYRGGR